MIIAIKIKLKPTKEQEVLFWKSAGTARWAYNYFLCESENHYSEYLKGNRKTKTISEGEVRKYINNILKKTTHKWLGEVGSNVVKQAVKDANLARQRWFDGISGKPKFKCRRKSKISFYVNYESLKRTKEGFQGEKLGIVKTYQSGLSTLFHTTFIRSFLLGDILLGSYNSEHYEYVYCYTIIHNFAIPFSILLNF